MNTCLDLSSSPAMPAMPAISALSNLSTVAVPDTARPVKRKTRITIYLDDDVLSQFRALSEQSGKGYQTLINAALRTRLAGARGE